MFDKQKKLPKEVECILEKKWQIIPLLGEHEDYQKGGKRPRFKDWFERSTCNKNEALEWVQNYSGMNWGLLPAKSNIVVIDIDDYSGGGKFWDDLGMVGMVSKTPTVRTPNGGYHLYFAIPNSLEIPYGKRCDEFEIPNMVVIPPSRVMASKTNGGVVQYQWALPTLPNLQPLPPKIIELIKGINTPSIPKKPLKSHPRASHNELHPYISTILEGELDKVSHAPEGERNSQLFKSVARLSEYQGEGGLTQGGIESLFEGAAMLANSVGHQNPVDEIRKTIQSGIRKGQQTPKQIPTNGLNGSRPLEVTQQPHIPQIAIPQSNMTPSITNPPNKVDDLTIIEECLNKSDMGDADLMVKMYFDRIQYDQLEKKFYLWDGEHWQPDKRKQVWHYLTHQVGSRYQAVAANVQHEMPDNLSDYSSSNQKRLVKDLNQKGQGLFSTRTLKYVLERLQNHQNVSRSGEHWRLEAHWLPVSNGVIDLTTGQLMRNEPRLFIKDWSPTEYKGLDHPAPAWEQFINEIFNNNHELINYVHKLVGFAITGYSREHIFPILYGTGANGKGTFVRALQDCLGHKLATEGSKAILQQARGNEATSALMATKGSRLVFVQETGAKVTVHAEQVKTLTGGDRRTGRRLRQEQETWMPQDTLFLITNPLPYFDAHDGAMWRRLRAINFNQSFVGREDRTLQEKLYNEREGILSWAVRGTLKYLSEGLEAPEIVQVTTNQYRESVDELAEFEREYFVQVTDAVTRRSSIYPKYEQFCKENRYRVRRRKEVFDYFRNRYKEKLNDGYDVFKGIGARH